MASTLIPVLSNSARLSFCLTTMRAPVLTLPISADAFAISFMVLSEKRPPSSLSLKISPKNFFFPSSSSAFLSSGCKTTMIPVTAMETMLFTIHSIVCISKIYARKMNTKITTTPFRSAHALVFLIQTII